MKKWTEYDDPASRAVFAAFAEALEPVLVKINPMWKVHHLELHRPPTDLTTNEQQVEIRVILKMRGQSAERYKLEKT